MIIKNFDRQQLTNTLKKVYDTYLVDRDNIISTASASLNKQIETLQQNLNFTTTLSTYANLANTLSDSLSAINTTGNIQDIVTSANCCSGTPSLENTVSFKMLEGLFLSAANLVTFARDMQNNFTNITSRVATISTDAESFVTHISSNWNTLSATPDAGNFILDSISGVIVDMSSYANTINTVMTDFSTLAQGLTTTVTCCSSTIPDNTFLSSVVSLSSDIKIGENQIGSTIRETQDKIKNLIDGLTRTTENFK